MLRKILLTLSASVLLGTAVIAPYAALAQFGPPLGPQPPLAGPPPGLGAGGPPPGLSAGGPPLGGPPAGPVAGLPPRGPATAPPRDFAGGPHRLDGAAGLHGLDRGGQANFRGVEGRAAAYSASSYIRNSYASYGYDRGYRHWLYAAAAAYAYGGGSHASSDDGCYYVSTSRRYGTRRVLVCHGNWLRRTALCARSCTGTSVRWPNATCLSGQILDLTPYKTNYTV